MRLTVEFVISARNSKGHLVLIRKGSDDTLYPIGGISKASPTGMAALSAVRVTEFADTTARLLDFQVPDQIPASAFHGWLTQPHLYLDEM